MKVHLHRQDCNTKLDVKHRHLKGFWKESEETMQMNVNSCRETRDRPNTLPGIEIFLDLV